MKIFITGGNGFLGKAITRDLEEHGHQTYVYDHSLVSRHDVLSYGVLRQAIEEILPDFVLHLAAAIYRADCEMRPKRATETNLVGTLNVAKICGERDIPLVYTSTSEVYGDWGHEVLSEDRSLDRNYFAGSINTSSLSGMYAITKLAGEHIAQTYAPEGLKIIRPVMAYGPGVPPGPGRRAMDNLIHQALTGQPMIVHRGAARTWCWIDDIASGFRAVIEKGDPGIYNVGRDDEEREMNDLAWMINQIVVDMGYAGSHVDIVDPPALQTVVKRLSCAKLCALGWEPTVDLDEGLPKMVAWVKTWMAAHAGALAP